MNNPTHNGARSRRATLALLAVTLLWGWTFVWMKDGVDVAQRELGARGVVAGVGLFMALRFGLAALALLALPAVRRGLDAGAWRGGAAIGAPLLVGFLLQMFGLRGVSPAVSAFLTSLYVLFTALILLARTHKRPSVALIAGALLATFGAGFIGGPPQLVWGFGELLTVACAFVFALHILVTDAVTKRVAPMPVTLTTMVFTAAGSAVVLAIGCALEGGPTLGDVLELATVADFARPMLFSSLFASAIALSLMNTYQRELEPVRAAIVYALEPVWAALISIALGREHASGWLWLGGGGLLAGNLIAELGPKLTSRQRRGYQSVGPRLDSSAHVTFEPSPAMTTTITDQVYSQLRQVFDPEIPVNIVDLGLIYDVNVDGPTCTVTMTLTSQACPEAKTIPDVVKRRCNTVAGITNTDVKIVWEPQWSPQRISPEGRKLLGIEEEPE